MRGKSRDFSSQHPLRRTARESVWRLRRLPCSPAPHGPDTRARKLSKFASVLLRMGCCMHGVSTAGIDPASFGRDRNVAEKSFDDTSVGDECGWFSALARSVLGGNKPGTALHYITGVDERSCQRYVKTRDGVEPKAYFLRLILHSKQGAPFFAALMHGCTAPWWLDLQREAEIGRKVLEITKRN